MKTIDIDNIEDFLYLFKKNNTVFSDIRWVEPIFISMLSVYNFKTDNILSSNNDYIQSMIKNVYIANKTYSPIERIVLRSDVEMVSKHLTEIMLKNFKSISISDLRDLRDYLQYLFSELLNNVADHTYSSIGGFSMAQYYPTNKKIQFAVADAGVGFLQNIRLNYKDVDTEGDAILKALKKGVTSTRARMYQSFKNAGHGLYAIFEILQRTGGKFVIISNDTLVRYNEEKIAIKKLPYNWDGAVVAFEFFESNIDFDMDYIKKNVLWNDREDEEDFF